MMKNSVTYIAMAIYDARFVSNPDRAICLVADIEFVTMEEARKEARTYGDLNCIVRLTITDGEIVSKELVEVVKPLK